MHKIEYNVESAGTESSIPIYSIFFLDKLWAHQDFKFDWNADITGIGSRSLNSLEYV